MQDYRLRHQSTRQHIQHPQAPSLTKVSIPTTVTQLAMDRVAATLLIDTPKHQRMLLNRSSTPRLLECPSTLLRETSARSHPMCHRSLHNTSMVLLLRRFCLLFECKSPSM